MKNIVLFDTSVGSLNQGDNIIMKAIKENIKDILENNFVVTMPTHTPCFYKFQEKNENKRFAHIKNCDYKFVCGTNIINYDMKGKWPNWNIYIKNCMEYCGSVLIGAGSSGIPENYEVSSYTKKILNKILSRDYVHSTRDEKTKKVLENMGFKAINTGCPTMWNLTKKFCEEINKTKLDSVIFTFTDYLPDTVYDQLLIDKLKENYDNVMFWPQGSKDYQYFMSKRNINGIKVISPDIYSFSDALNAGADYIGTRLHAGIFAMQHKMRAFILGVDNRSIDISKNFGINVIMRSELDNIGSIINRDYTTLVDIYEERIAEWKRQFL